jgi:hypothetical protein
MDQSKFNNDQILNTVVTVVVAFALLLIFFKILFF